VPSSPPGREDEAARIEATAARIEAAAARIASAEVNPEHDGADPAARELKP
jgi:hypothetical protein